MKCRAILVASVGTLAALVLSQPASADWFAAIADSAPLHWYAFEDSGGDVAADFGSGAMDGTYTNGALLGEPGRVGFAAGFDGVDDYIDVGGTDLVGTDWTVEAIFQAGAGGPSQGILGGVTMALKADQWNNTGQLGYTNFGVIDVTLSPLTPSEFAHVAYVGTSAGVDLYFEGVLVDGGTTTAVLARDVIGAGRVNPDGAVVDPLDGQIDELVIYDRALEAEEIALHFDAINGVPACDFDSNGACDVVDLDALLYTGIPNNDLGFDLDDNGTVDLADRDEWLAIAGNVNIGVPYVVGDSDLNGDVVSSDLNALALSWQKTDLQSWANGDFNGDGTGNAQDLNDMALNWQHGAPAPVGASAAAVPEPASLFGFGSGVLLLAFLRWRRPHRLTARRSRLLPSRFP